MKMKKFILYENDRFYSTNVKWYKWFLEKNSLEAVRVSGEWKMVRAALDMRYWDSLDWYRDCRDGEKETYTKFNNVHTDQSNEHCYFSHSTFQKILM